MAVRGDWRIRVLALSAIGRVIRDDRTAWRPSAIRHLGWYVPAFRQVFPTVGRRGAFARGPLINALGDRIWIVRMAAALALGECRDPANAGALKPLLRDHHRAVRLAATAALAAAGAWDAIPAADPLGGDPAPPRIGEATDARVWISTLVGRHLSIVTTLSTAVPGIDVAPDGDASTWAGAMAGRAAADVQASPQAEMARYADEADNRHNLSKPFTPGPRDQNTRLVHSFAALAEHIDAPQGGRILDLGGGGGWVSEILTKLGYRAVTFDVAVTLLQLARRRFARDQLPPRIVAGDLTSLPFGDEAFDAVVVFDALHHVGDVAGALCEAYRVLATGGRLLLAEPGEGHSETEKSRGEMSQYGIREGEIHVFEIVALALAAGFHSARVIPHYVPNVHFTPDDLRAAMRQPPEAWRIRHPNGVTARIDEYILQSIFSHPIMSFSKGTRVVDSRAPSQLRALLLPELVRDGVHVRGLVRVQNMGETLWLRGAEAGGVRLGLQLLTAERAMIERDHARFDLPRSVPAGGTVDLSVAIVVPDHSAHYVLKVDLVSEGVCWFEDVGSIPAYVPL
jgi:SAM-dependent methyltransferase